MSEGILVELGLIIVLILANGFFAASEIAIVSARKGRLEQQALLGRRGAAAALELAEDPSRFLSTVQIGITVISTFAAVFGGASLTDVLAQALQAAPVVGPYANTIALVLVVVLISYCSLILGELVPKRLALQSAETVSSAVAPFMRQLARVARPLVSLLTVSTELVLLALGRRHSAEAPVTEDDIIALVREGALVGTVEAAEQQLIANVFHFTERTVRSLMTPRTQIVAVSISTPFTEALGAIVESGYSRVPVFRDSLDSVVGILYVKDVLHAWGQRDTPELAALLRPAMYVLESQRAPAVFQQLRQVRSALAMVIDEYGQVSGLVTMEDLLEEVVGEIEDEYDEASVSITHRPDGTMLIDGLLSFDAVKTELGLLAAEPDHGADFETLAGFLLSQLGHIPEVGEAIEWHGYRFEVMDMDGRRIDKVLLAPPAPQSELAVDAAPEPADTDAQADQ